MDGDTNDPGGSGPTDRPARTDETPERPTRVRHDWTRSDHPSMAVVEAVAAVTDRTATELPPLQETIDTDALDALFDGESPSVTVSFRYADTDVSVIGHGTLEVRVDGDAREDDE